MPNIEIFGFEENEAKKWEKKIFDAFQSKPYVQDIVVTIHHNTTARDMKGKSQPFIRVSSSPNCHIEEILEVISSLKIDVEHLLLKCFLPAENRATSSKPGD